MNDGESLKTISRDGEVPEVRFGSARSVQSFCLRMIQNDSQRNWKRSRVSGLVAGNPPYRSSKLREAGRADACNVNWMIAEAYLQSAVGAFYDLFSEAPDYITVKTDYGSDEQKENYSRIISEEADRILREDQVWDYNVQLSQWNMVLHGCGPLLFEDAFKVLPKAFQCGDLKVPEFTKSDTAYFDACMIQAIYYPPELYEFIKDEKSAKLMGWDVEYTKRVIENAMDIRTQQGVNYEWEFYQQELKNNALNYMYDDSKICYLAHVYWKEFDGKITHSIVERDTTTGGTSKPTGTDPGDIKFLFQKVGRYRSFQEAIHPMYFDHGHGGYHHSVTGMGVKMFSAMEYQNRLICNLADKAFAPKILFKPTTTEASQRFELATFGDYAVLPPGFEWNQTGVAGLMNDGLAMNRELSDVISSNLSSYRQQPMKQDGNPPTAKQVVYDAQQQSALSKTQFNRYYEQLDMLYAEIYRRLSNLNSPDKRAKEFQDRCRKRNVPEEALNRIRSVQATRVVGQGSAFMRKQSLDQLWVTVGQALPEEGRDNLISDKIAAEAGQAAVSRYYPQRKSEMMATDQQAEARMWIGLMKVGTPPVITPNQNAVIFATEFLKAASQAVQSLQKGANPAEVLGFLELCGPAIMAHLRRFGQDQARQQLLKVLLKQWKQLAGITDQLKKRMMQMQQQAQQAKTRTGSVLNEQQLKELQTKADIARKDVKTQQQMKIADEKHRLKVAQSVQDMAISDAKAAHELTLNRLTAFRDEPSN